MVAAAVALTGALAASPMVAVTPAWDGRWSAGRVTALLVEIVSGSPGTAHGVVRDGFQETAFTFQLDSGEKRRLWLPVRPGVDGRVLLDAEMPDGAPVRLAAEFKPSDGPVGVRVGDAGGGDAGVGLRVSLSELPDVPESYETLSTLVLERSVAGRLTWAQRRAVAEFAARCGSLRLPGWPPEAAAALTAGAGCIGNDPRPDAGSRGAVSVPQVAGLLPDEPVRVMLDRMTVFLGAYLIVLAGLSWLPRGWSPGSLAAPAAALAVCFALFPEGRAGRHSASWAETGSGDSTAVHTSVVETVGSGYGSYHAEIPRAFGFPLALSPHDRMRVSLADAHPDHFEVNLPAALLSRSRLRLGGSFAVVPGIRAYDSGLVANLSGAATGPGLAASHGVVWLLPALAAGERWRPGDGDPSAPPGAVTRLLAERAGDRSAALVPLAATAASPADAGWLAVFANGEREPGP